jgi:branched-chain amino acid transport system substrate-binding protein
VFGPNPAETFSKGYFDLVTAESPKPKTLAILAADAEFSRNASIGARANAKAAGLEIVYDKTYPPSTIDFTPIVRAVQAAEPDIVYVASYPPDTVGILRAVDEIGLKTKMLGGAFVGLPSAALKTQLGPAMNGVVNVEGIDPLGYFLPPFAYGELQILGTAIEATKSLDDGVLADYMHSHSFRTIVGDIAFGADGEWTEGRPIWVQYHGIKGHDVDQFRGPDPATMSILAPETYKTGTMVYPYTKLRETPASMK